MNSLLFRVIKCSLILICCHSGYLQASLLISPTQVTLNDRERSTSLVLINTGQETRTYRLSWQQKSVLENGSYHNLTEEEAKTFPTASGMIRFSPKQVTLKPDERQTIRLAVRRPKGLADGEYRSHLLLKALPPKSPESSNVNGIRIKLNVVMSYSLPIIVRQGEIDASVALTSVTLAKEKTFPRATITALLNHSGRNSVTGNIIAYWQPSQDAPEQIVARVHGYTVYPELTQHKIQLTWPDYTPARGNLRLAFEGVKEFNGVLLAEKSILVTLDSIKTVP
ncbi:molecular chaperone [Shewanella sp.]|uniref:fimbrial biogenesis chaperone n=1 Tax=Shewanella sp. TaxID=50422 RepID=UPI001EB9C598|nr:fimbria/pilus periplasmic chaperone [Shewanella sp.]NRB23575.1 molecular chaperone [Shewanella sp.]